MKTISTRSIGAAHRQVVTHFVAENGKVVAVAIKNGANTVFGYIAGIIAGEPEPKAIRAQRKVAAVKAKAKRKYTRK